ncbi:hypothetical protein RRG08_026916, partial [Elysia crispata]
FVRNQFLLPSQREYMVTMDFSRGKVFIILMNFHSLLQWQGVDLAIYRSPKRFGNVDNNNEKHLLNFSNHFQLSEQDLQPWNGQPDSSFPESDQSYVSDSGLRGVASNHDLLIIPSAHSCRWSAVYVDCSNSDLYSIPTTKFPVGIQIYDLSKNYIAALPSRAFSEYSSLRKLFLQQNLIVEMDSQAFVGLSNLELLDLSANRLVMNETSTQTAFKENVFVPLENLKKLRLEQNNPFPNDTSLRYPHKALSQLANLEELGLDGFSNVVFESGFANLTRLRNLSLDGYRYGHCQLYGLKNETFKNLRFLEHLSMTDCSLKGHGIEAGAFLPLNRLRSLNISNNQDINVQFFDRVFYGLQNATSLKILNMRFVVNLYTLGVCLSSKYIKYFPQSVEHLVFEENKLECIDRNVIDKVRNSLKTLDISRNSLVFGTYLLDLPKLKHLTSLYLDNYRTVANRLPKKFPYNPKTPPLDTDNCSLYDQNIVENEHIILRLPPMLKYVCLRYIGMEYIISTLEVDPNNSLETLVMEGLYLPKLEGPVSGLHSLRTCLMASNKIENIDEHFFETLSSLEMLNLSSNHLGNFFYRNKETRIFQPLNQLETLDLSSNTIRVLSREVFHGLSQLKTLRISHNPISRFFADISHMNRLQNFMAADTDLGLLSKEVRSAITRRLELGSPFHVDLQESPISCNCENLPFLRWMVSSKAFKFENKKYQCSYPDSTYRDIKDGYKETLETLSRECSSKEVLFLIVGAATLGFVAFIIISLVYRYRWKLRYMYHAAYIYLKPGNDTRSDNRFEYDVFVCYAEEDRLFVMNILYPALESRGLSLFVHHRHFTAGELIGSNIVRAVRTCRRTVVVLTRTLAVSSWCNFEIQMANMESAHRGIPILIFLLLDEMKGSEMGAELLFNVQNNTYIPIPTHPIRNDDALKTLWDKLARDIKN